METPDSPQILCFNFGFNCCLAKDFFFFLAKKCAVFSKWTFYSWLDNKMSKILRKQKLENTNTLGYCFSALKILICLLVCKTGFFIITSVILIWASEKIYVHLPRKVLLCFQIYHEFLEQTKWAVVWVCQQHLWVRLPYNATDGGSSTAHMWLMVLSLKIRFSPGPYSLWKFRGGSLLDYLPCSGWVAKLGL